MLKRITIAAASAALLMAAGAAHGRDYPADPLESPMWDYRAREFFGDAPVRFDPRVKLVMPAVAEDQRAFPVALDARGIAGAERLVIFADLNPIPLAVDYRLGEAAAYVATRMKLDQRTPVRGAVQMKDGSWLVGGGWIDAAGGGCSAPPVGRVKGDWADHLGEMHGFQAPVSDNGTRRLRLTIRHPMDTGLVENIGTYHVETIAFTGAGGRDFGAMTIHAAMSEDPSIGLILPGSGGAVTVHAVDTGGRTFDGTIAAGA